MQRTDSIAVLVKQYLNAKDVDRLYDLTASSFRSAITKDNFRNVTEKNLFPLGELKELTYERSTQNALIYKAEFASVPLTVGIGLEADDKVGAFFFQSYVAPAKPKDITKIASNNPLKTELDKEVDSIAMTYISTAGTVGMSIGVLKDGKEYFYDYGEASKTLHEIPDANTIFELGSITKTFTATIVACAIGEKKIKLDDPVNKYLPDSIPPLQFNNRMVTFKDLLNHTAAFPRMPSDYQDEKMDENGITIYPVDKFFSFLKNLKLTREPGLKHEYSNAGFSLASTIMQRMYNMSYEELVNKFIAQPLGMRDTRVWIRPQDSAHYAKGYREDGSLHFYRNLPPFYQGAGGLRSTASDMLKYAAAQWGTSDKKLNKAIRLTHDTTFRDNKFSLGMAWIYVKNGDRQMMFHNGATGGFRSYLGVDPEKKVAVIILVNAAVGVDQQGSTMMRYLTKD
ncbi:MAG: serine hydrolase [Pseudobacter sp.]|uniref:serine hydrolase n=1 Tax=Pseudobacter sp. TaxID=2045420 RepID=UPI003F7CE81B